MSHLRNQSLGKRVWALVRAQHGVITHGQLVGLGFGSEAIKHRLAKGRLHSVTRGVYAVGRPELTREGQWMAAVLACGDGAVISHLTAAVLWRLLKREGPVIEVSVPSGAGRKRAGIRVHRRTQLSVGQIAKKSGIPVTTPAMTLIDLATRPRTSTGVRQGQACCAPSSTAAPSD
jgi:predicted transcriptional regulator of viral defense system